MLCSAITYVTIISNSIVSFCFETICQTKEFTLWNCVQIDLSDSWLWLGTWIQTSWIESICHWNLLLLLIISIHFPFGVQWKLRLKMSPFQMFHQIYFIDEWMCIISVEIKSTRAIIAFNGNIVFWKWERQRMNETFSQFSFIILYEAQVQGLTIWQVNLCESFILYRTVAIENNFVFRYSFSLLKDRH